MATPPTPDSDSPVEPNWATDSTISWSPGSGLPVGTNSGQGDRGALHAGKQSGLRARDPGPTRTRAERAPSANLPPPGSPPSVHATAGLGVSQPIEEHESEEETDDLVERTRRQIRRLTQEIATLSRSELSLQEFLAGFLTRVTQALVSQGAAVWLKEPDAGLQLAFQVQLPDSLIEAEPNHLARHQGLLERHIERNETGLVPPRAGAANDGGLFNPTDSLLVLAPLHAGEETVGIVEVFQRPGSGPATQRGYLRFLAQMAEHASVFLKNHRYRVLRERHEMLERLDRFSAEVHRHLDLESVLFAVVNEGRNVVEVDRVAIAIKRRGRWQVRAVSGLDSIERRSAELKAAGRLISSVCRVREPLWCFGEDASLPPQIETPLHEYLDLAHSKSLGIVPLFPPLASNEENVSGSDGNVAPIGCLIFERLTRAGDERDSQRALAVASHVERALSNALELESVPLSRVLRRVGRAYRNLHFGTLSTVGLVLAAVIAVIGGLFLIPYGYSIKTPGQLIPSQRQDVYAPIDGTIDIIDVTHGDVQTGDRLIQLTNEQLIEEISTLESRRRQLEQQITTVKQQLVGNASQLTPADELKLHAEQASAQTEAASIQRTLELKRKEVELLSVVAPISGSLVDDQITQRLQRRRVDRGQKLMTLVNPSGSWELELYLPEKRLWELREAQGSLGEQLSVEFELATLPGTVFHGQIAEVDRFAVVQGTEGNSIAVKVKIDRDDIPAEVRVSGARVIAKIEAGQKSVAYILFNDFWQMLRSQVLFPLS